MSWWRKEKKLNLFGVSKKDTPDVFLTITNTKDESLEYVKKDILFKHIEHFRSWAQLRNLDWTEWDTQDTYLTDCIDIEEWSNYYIVPLYYTYPEIASMIRMFGNYIPLNCSFEFPQEKLYWLTSQNSEDLKKILENSDSLFLQLDEKDKDTLREIIKESEQDNEHKSR